jgi:small basic protein (TIGR04137 family)
MSVHPSLSGKSSGKESQTVLKRLEKIKKLKEEGKWKEGDPVYGLPKVKTVRLKLKKEKAVKAEGAEGAAAEGAAPAAGAAPAPGAAPAAKKPEAGAKEKESKK